MKVAQLIEQLRQLPQDAEVKVWVPESDFSAAEWVDVTGVWHSVSADLSFVRIE